MRVLSIFLCLMVISVMSSSVIAAEEDSTALQLEIETLKNDMIELNKELFLLEEEILFPASTEVSVFLSVDVGEFMKMESVVVKIDGDLASQYLYDQRESEALNRGGVHRLFKGNLKTGQHELVATITGLDKAGRSVKRGVELLFEKELDAKYIQLVISDDKSIKQSDLLVKQW